VQAELRGVAAHRVEIPRIAARGRLVLFGLFGVGNFGNDATLRAALHQLRSRLPHASIACVCAERPRFAAEFGVEPLPLDPLPPKGRWRIPSAVLRETYVGFATALTEPVRRRRVAARLAGVDRFIVVGTGVLDDYGELPWTTPGWLLRWSSLAARAGVGVDMLAVGAGPIHSAINRKLLVSATRHAGRRSFRDEASRQFVTGLGVDTSGDITVPDLAFALPQERLPPPPRRDSLVPSIGVGLMGYYGWRNNPSRGRAVHEAYVERMAEFVAQLLRDGCRVRLLIGELSSDEPVVKRVVACVDERVCADERARLVAPRIADDADLVRQMAGTDVVVASRFHNLVLALASGRPVVSVGYSSKFDALMDAMGLEDFSVRIEDAQVGQLYALTRRALDSRDELAVRITVRAAGCRSAVEELFDAWYGGRWAEGEDRS
jgi:polysaccharide pyruvyl transferase WcaK-like protein